MEIGAVSVRPNFRRQLYAFLLAIGLSSTVQGAPDDQHRRIADLASAARDGDIKASIALLLAGPRGQRALAVVLERTTHVDQLARELPAHVASLKGDKSILAYQLSRIASDRTLADDNRQLACVLLGMMGREAQSALPVLRTLSHESQSPLAGAATLARDEIGDPSRLPDLIDELKNASTSDERVVEVIGTLSLLGPAAKAATPVAAARTHRLVGDDLSYAIWMLGVFGDSSSVPLLTSELGSTYWRVQMAAAHSLGRLGRLSNSALPTLAALAGTHWLPRVRRYAREARMRILASVRDPTERSIRGNEVEAWQTTSSPTDGPCKPITITEDWSVSASPSSDTRKRFQHLLYRPQDRLVSLPSDDGLLVGTDRGENSGELLWVRGEHEELILKGGVFAIIPDAAGPLILRRQEDLIPPKGSIVRLVRTSTGSWRAVVLLELPGAPLAYRRGSGELELATTRGLVVLRPDSTVKRYSCAEDR